ncbi:HAD-IA family hydrolase [Phormidium sp. CLA17]|uniref:HAD-IA family hydrolase n=1 Tax=Leptolyngbya sp. Cla-17 TaxID=2803751 RepID=UPI001490FACC|nr:HAD-IA family hydrolase [Leptolyngbya sp. Cla-17]MBM0743628.1 HAD-IA family hydrolase [Leptolyngbya sp. Cla-17]
MSDSPSVIFLDAVGTLFGVQGSVGEQYAKVAGRFGVDLPAEALNQAFFKSFQASGSPAFPACDSSELKAKEYAWWFDIAVETFQHVDALHQFSDFEAFFAELFAYFAAIDPWQVYPDAPIALKRWQQLGISLGVLSNFDSRIYSVLQGLNLMDFFESITISTEAGTAKPDSRIFEVALHKHKCQPQDAWHIGDSFTEDYQAAQNAGLRGIWLRRAKGT